MAQSPRSRALASVPLLAAIGLVVSACGSSGDTRAVQAATPVQPVAAPARPAADPAPSAAGPASRLAAPAAPAAPAALSAGDGKTPANAPASSAKKAVRANVRPAAIAAPPGSQAPKGSGAALTKIVGSESADQQAANQQVYEQKDGATDVGITKSSIKLGSVNMHGMALGNLITAPMVRGSMASAAAINDRGGVLGRRISIDDCDDGPGEVSRAKACIKKLVNNDKIFALTSGVDWATASIHDDLKQYRLPYIGAWAYSQTEWQDPFMFPTHMSMIHEAMAGAHWVANVVKPTTYGLICLTSPEMQLACNEVSRILDTSGSKLVKRADVSISETSMSAYVLAMRAAAPEHIIHYVINPATVAKFMVESQQQGYYPPKGISGNHLAGEALGGLFGAYPVGRYWTNTTYKLWGAEFIATMHKYARGNDGANHHIVQAGYVGMNIFAEAARAAGPNLTRDRVRAVLGNGTVWQADASLDQRFSYIQSERTGESWNHEYGQGREFMYKYGSANTASNPDGSPSGWTPDADQPVIYTWK